MSAMIVGIKAQLEGYSKAIRIEVSVCQYFLCPTAEPEYFNHTN